MLEILKIEEIIDMHTNVIDNINNIFIITYIYYH
jgi:hypothetical protein